MSDRQPVVFGVVDLDALAAEARALPRRRKNRNFHHEAAHPAQRLLNAVEPDSYVRPHRHRHPDQAETLVALRGAFGLVWFADDGTVAGTAVLGSGGAAIGVDIPPGTYHTLIALEAGSVFFEAKAGPYVAATDKEFAPWAPAEGTTAAMAWLERLRALFPAGR